MNFDAGQSIYQEVLSQTYGNDCRLIGTTPVSGGCINNGVILKSNKGKFFLKWHEGDFDDMFEKEFQGLNLLRDQQVVTIPEPYATGHTRDISYLLLEYIENGKRSSQFWTDFAHKLGSMHAISSDRYGLDHNNYIGRLPQLNEWSESWLDFFIEKRLMVQLNLGQKNNFITHGQMKLFEGLFRKLPDLIPDESPCLLHGDLWSGNFLTGEDGLVCLIDPAVYYGNREIEIAFTHLFGGFEREFYDHYDDVCPLVPGFSSRIDIYNLYPLLVHVNLFGGSYLPGILKTLGRYVT